MKRSFILLILVVAGCVSEVFGQSPAPGAPAAPIVQRKRVMRTVGNADEDKKLIPSQTATDVSEGYGAAKWGMNPEDFEKAFPSAKKGEIRDDDDVWQDLPASRYYTMKDAEKNREFGFAFLRGKLVRIDILIIERLPAFWNDILTNEGIAFRNGLHDQMKGEFKAQPESGVVIELTLPNGPGQGAPIRSGIGLPGPASRPPVDPKPISGEGAVQPANIRIMIWQKKLQESLNNEFKTLVEDARKKAIEKLLPKLAPP